MKASDLLVRCLEEEGIEYIFGVPGEENADFMMSLEKSDKIRFILTRHEQGAGFMAATYGRLTGKVGVCLSTLGPGATNLVTPAAYAQLGAMPMLVITGQKPIKSSKQGRFQVIDVVDMMRPITKYTAQVVSGDRIPSMIREAFRLAHEERPGAVHIELPEDIAHGESDLEPIRRFAESIGTEIISVVPRDPLVGTAELHRQSIVEHSPGSPVGRSIGFLADRLMRVDRAALPVPTPLAGDGVRDVMRGTVLEAPPAPLQLPEHFPRNYGLG